MMQTSWPWDGVRRAYRPRPDWRSRIGSSVRLHTGVDDDLSPVTHEILRNRLWTINIAHADTVARMSGSPVLATGFDMNMCILTEDGENVVNAPYMQYLSTAAPLRVAYLLERFSETPGIAEGDVWVGNDPWIDALHQMDVLFSRPVFRDGALFAWVASAGHQYDLGGLVPGGWTQNALDVFSDPTILRTFRLVEAGVLRPDLEELYLRQSRMPELVALDLRAMLAGINVAHDEVQRICDKFGADTVKAAMRKILDDGQRTLGNKLQAIPDARWTSVRYFDEMLPGDRSTQRVQLSFTKRADRLEVSNEGTAAQVPGTGAFTFTGFAGGVLAMLAITMMHESLFAVDGGARQLDFTPVAGTMTCADYPAAVSGSVMNTPTHMYQALTLIAQMLVTAPELRDDVIAGSPEIPLAVLVGQDEEGTAFGQALLEGYGSGSGARSFRDGIDVGGPGVAPLGPIPSVERLEQWFPLVYLYRKQARDSGGAGRWRGGTSLVAGVTPHRVTHMNVVTTVGGQAASTHSGGGLFGAYPGATARYLVRQSTDLADWIDRKVLPPSIDALTAATSLVLGAKSDGTPLREGDVLELRVGGAGGFGDPLLREPERVAHDVGAGLVSLVAAEGVYGVILTDDGIADEERTRARRAELRTARRRWQLASERFPTSAYADGRAMPATGEPGRAVHEYVVTADRDGARVLACTECGEVLCGYLDSFKRHLRVDVGELTRLPTVADPHHMLDPKVELRHFCCPGCGVLMSTEIVMAGEDIVDDLILL